MRDVKRIRFSTLNIGEGDRWISLGGIRLYNKGVMLPSGGLISESLNVAEMENMVVKAKSKYRNHYMVHHATLTTRSQVGNYPDNGYWLAADNTVDAWYELELKVAADIDMIEWVQKPDSQYGSRGVANPMIIEFYRSDETLIERVTTNGNRIVNSVTQLGIHSSMNKWLVENGENIKYWTGSAWMSVPNTG